MTELITRTQPAPLVLGAVAFGKPKPTTRDHPLSSDEACDDLLRAFAELGGEELDTSRVYQNGNCEAVIGRVPAGQSLRVGTKYHPSLEGGPVAQMEQTLMALGRESVSIYYIHMPSIEIPLEETLAEINQCHEAGQLEEFGLSNFPAWQVVEIAQFCRREGYVMPTVYQGVYNALNRTAEYELVPVLRNYGLRYYTHGRRPATIERYLAGVSVAHQAAGYDSPTQSTAVRAVLAGIRREHKAGDQRQAKAIDEDALHKMVSTLDDSTSGVRDRALVLLGFAGMLRRSELVGLTCDDVEDHGPHGLIVIVRTSKRDQTGKGRRVQIARGRLEATCPVRSLLAWIDLACDDETNESFIFRPVNRHGGIGDKPMTGKAVGLVIKRTALAAGLDPEQFSGHSLRRGGATVARRNGADRIDIARHGGWADDSAALARYFEDADELVDPVSGKLGL